MKPTPKPEFGQPSRYLEAGATLSADGVYRYRLWRVWNPDAPTIVWVLLNPSTADGETDDPTVRRCVGFARSWHAGSITIVNLYAYRATDPRDLIRAVRSIRIHPIGPENDEHIEQAVKSPGLAQVVCGWGTLPAIHRERARFVRAAICSWRGIPKCLGITKVGDPYHPLFRPGHAPLVDYRG